MPFRIHHAPSLATPGRPFSGGIPARDQLRWNLRQVRRGGFHQQLIDAAGNELISRTYSKLHVRQIVVGVSALFRTGGRREQVCSEHQDILDALVSGDAAKAQKAIDHHLAVTRDILLRN